MARPPRNAARRPRSWRDASFKACPPETLKRAKPNVERLAEELADIDAAISWLFELLDLDVEAHNARMDRKMTGFREWQAMIQRATAKGENVHG